MRRLGSFPERPGASAGGRELPGASGIFPGPAGASGCVRGLPEALGSFPKPPGASRSVRKLPEQPRSLPRLRGTSRSSPNLAEASGQLPEAAVTFQCVREASWAAGRLPDRPGTSLGATATPRASRSSAMTPPAGPIRCTPSTVRGNAGVMQARVQDQVWTFTGESLRFTGGFRDDGNTFAGVWEQLSSDGVTWLPWMDVTLRKAR
jgi:hypothetical protein